MTVFSLFRNVSQSRGFAAAAPVAAVLCLVAATAGAADIVVSGLPSGLSVGVRVETGNCVTGGGASSSRGVSLTEQVFRRYESGSIGGHPTMRLIEGSTYEGDLVVDTFSAAGTQCPPEHEFRAFVSVSGRREGSTSNSFRETAGTAATWVGDTGTFRRFVFRPEVQAKTGDVTDSDAQAPAGPTLNRDQVVNWSIPYRDSFGAESVVEPRLEFFTVGLAGLPRGSRGSLSTLLFRLIVTVDNRACLVAAGQSSCGPINRNISLSLGSVTVTRVSVSPSGTDRSIRWTFRLAPDFPTGQVEVVARARDQAPLLGQRRFLYRIAGPSLVVGVVGRPKLGFRDLELLPWQESSFLVTVQ